MDFPEQLKVLLAHQDSEIQGIVRKALMAFGAQVMDDCPTAELLVRRALEESPDLIISGTDLPDGSGVKALVRISNTKAIPSIIITNKRTLLLVEEALKDHVMAYLIEPVSVDDIKPAVYLVLKRFEQFEELRQEVIDLKQTLAERKVVERAKGILMSRESLSEEDAYKRLRRLATNRRMKLIEAARHVLDAEERANETKQTG